MLKYSKRPNTVAFVLNIGKFDLPARALQWQAGIRNCVEFRISIFGFCLNMSFRSGTVYIILKNHSKNKKSRKMITKCEMEFHYSEKLISFCVQYISFFFRVSNRVIGSGSV